MKVKVDFQLNHQFGVVEQLLFRLVLNGFTDIKEISEALPVFSDSVLANGIKMLVNRQILSVKTDTGILSLSEAIMAILEMCLQKEYVLDVSEEIERVIREEGLLVSSATSEEGKILMKAIMNKLLPGVRLDMFMDSLDFIICNAMIGDQDG